MHAGGHDERRATDSGRSSANCHPIAFHSRNYSICSISHIFWQIRKSCSSFHMSSVHGFEKYCCFDFAKILSKAISFWLFGEFLSHFRVFFSTWKIRQKSKKMNSKIRNAHFNSFQHHESWKRRLIFAIFWNITKSREILNIVKQA